jgi:hypothetical protein
MAHPFLTVLVLHPICLVLMEIFILIHLLAQFMDLKHLAHGLVLAHTPCLDLKAQLVQPALLGQLAQLEQLVLRVQPDPKGLLVLWVQPVHLGRLEQQEQQVQPDQRPAYLIAAIYVKEG